MRMPVHLLALHLVFATNLSARGTGRGSEVTSGRRVAAHWWKVVLLLPFVLCSLNADGQSRVYFSTTAESVAPAFHSQWNYTSEAARYKLSKTKGTSIVAAGTRIGPWTTGTLALDRQYVSDPLAAQTISGTVRGYMMMREYAGTDDVGYAYATMKVVSNDGTTLRGTLLTLSVYQGSFSEFINNASHKNETIFSSTTSITSLAVQDGDRLVIEIGYSDLTGSSPEASSMWGENAPDCATNETDTTACAGWVEFTNGLIFQGESTAPVIDNLSPTSGAVGNSVTITGSRFGSTQGNSTVTFNGTAAAVSTWSATSIATSVPAGATTGPVVVAVDGQASNSATFTVVPQPSITSLTPNTGAVGTSVTITGSNFGAAQGTSSVTFNGLASTPTNWSDTGITTTVPTEASSGSVVVTVMGVPSNGRLFTIPGSKPTYHLHAEQSGGLRILSTSAPDVAATSLQTTDIKDAAAGTNRLFPTFKTLSGVPNTSGVLQTGETFTLRVWMRKTANFGVLYPMAHIHIKSTGSPICTAIGTTPLTTTVNEYTLSCNSSANVTFAAADRYWTSPGVNVGTSTNKSVFGEIYFEGVWLGNYNSRLTVPLPPPTPVISSLSPASAAFGTPVVISGAYFGPSQGSSTVSFNGFAASPSSWGDTSITVPVPPGSTSGPVVVSVDGRTSNSATFSVIPAPYISGIAPTAGPANTTVTVTGLLFGSTQGTGSISFNGVGATLVSWSDTEIVARAPVGATTGPVVVSAGGFSSNGITFTMVPPPAISTVSPLSGAAGGSVTISGSNFGASQGTSAVRFNGTAASVSAWTDSSITAAVPDGATTGPLTVSVSGVSSNGVTFTVVTTGTLSGRLTRQSDGTGIVGGSVEALQSSAVKGSATTGADGTYTIASLPAETYDVRASAAGFGTAVDDAVSVAADETTTHDISLTLPGSVTGTVIRASDLTAISGAELQVLAGTAVVGTATTNGTGSYTLSDLNAGTYRVRASASGYVSKSTADLTVSAGTATTADFSLQMLGTGLISYGYDSLGRLVSVVDSNGDSATYEYDAVGNILSISQQNANILGIVSFTPESGAVGTQVTISGTGFATTPADNTVRFNGVIADVSSATATELVATVPSGTTSGSISVTTAAGTANSDDVFTLTTTGAPTVSSFTPTIGTVGTTVTVSGTNFNPNTQFTRIRFNNTALLPSAATATSITTTVPAVTASGPIRVSTPLGEAVSADDFFIPFGTHLAADVEVASRMAIGGALPVALGTLNKIGLVVFDAPVGQKVSIQTSNGTYAGCTLYLFEPHAQQMVSTNCGGASSFTDTQTLRDAGTYTVGIDAGTNVGSLLLQINNANDFTGLIATDGTPAVFSTSTPGQNALFSFSGTGLQRVSIVSSGSTFGFCNLNLSLLRPDQTTLTAQSCASPDGFIDVQTLPTSGSYRVKLDPASSSTGSVTVRLYNVPADFSNSIATDGTPVTVPTSVPGQNGVLTFAGSSGQKISINVFDSTYGICYLTVRIVAPSGGTLASNTCVSPNAFFDTWELTETGTYSIQVDPNGPATGSVNVAVFQVPADQTGSITINGSAVVVSTTVPGQNGQLTFGGSEGQQITVTTSDGTYGICNMGVSIVDPNSAVLASNTCMSPGGSLGPQTLTTTGTHVLRFDPPGASTGSITVTLTSP
jgi:YD repeat-containing protein